MQFDHNQDYAVFGHVSYDILKQLTAEFGFRYDWNYENQYVDPTSTAGVPSGCTENNGQDCRRSALYTQGQPKVTLSYRVDPDLTLYTDYGVGFRSGQFNQAGAAEEANLSGVAHKGSHDTEIKHGIFFPNNDPAIYATAMARATKELCFVISQSTSFEHPFNVARKFNALDNVSGGRIGWNIVTSGLPSMSAIHGHKEIIPHDTRYEIADEFLEVAYKLLEGGWSPGYDRRLANDGFFFDPARVNTISHRGRHFDLTGPFSATPSPQRTPLLFQAGNSGPGMRFAARHAEVILVAMKTPASARETVARVRELAAEFGREPSTLRFLLPCAIIPDETDAKAEKRLESYKEHWSEEAALAGAAIYSGYDLASMDPENYVDYQGTERSQTNARAMEDATRAGKKVKDVIRETVRFGSYLSLTGGPQRVADEMERWMEEGDLDGFNLISYVHPADYTNTVDYVVPELQRRGRYKTSYAAGTLRQRVMGGAPLLPSHHTGAAYRAA